MDFEYPNEEEYNKLEEDEKAEINEKLIEMRWIQVVD